MLLMREPDVADLASTRFAISPLSETLLHQASELGLALLRAGTDS
jgi:hypothetical protein